MKKSDIERQLKKDLQAAAPSDFDAVWKKCRQDLPEKETEEEFEFVPAVAAAGGGEAGRSGRAGKRTLACILAAVIFCFAALFTLLGAALGWFRGGDDFVIPGSDGYFIFDINPSVELSYDKTGRVTGAEGLNEDGEVLLYGLDLQGKTYDEAADVLFKRCVKLGYFASGREDNAVLVSAVLSEGGRDETMTAEMKGLLSEAFAANKIRGVVITGVENAQLEEAAQKYGIDAQKYALILSYLALGGSLEEAAYSSVSVRELYQGISKLQKERKEKEIEELETEAGELEETLFETLSENIQKLIDELSDYIEERAEDSEDSDGEDLKDKYEKQLEELEAYAEEMEDAQNKGEFGSLVHKLLNSLAEMSRNESDAALKELIDAVYTQIASIYDGLEDMWKELKHLSATAEETSSARLNKFGNSVGEDDEFDIDEWQEEKEELFASSWYDFKKQWDAARDRDLDDDD